MLAHAIGSLQRKQVAGAMLQPLRWALSGPHGCSNAAKPYTTVMQWQRSGLTLRQQLKRRGLATWASDRQSARSARFAAPGGATIGQQQQQPLQAALPMPSHQLPPGAVELSPLACREWLLQQVPVQRFKAVGVSFEHRQEAVKKLRPGQAVALVREPNNPADPKAVAIHTLAGESLGYIAKDQTFHFMQNVCFGAVGSAGQAGGEDGLWGFNVLVQPSIPPVEVYAFPSSLYPNINLGLHLRGPAWDALKGRVHLEAQGRCQVTSAPLAAVHERWSFDEEALVVRLLGLRAEAPEVQQIEGLLGLGRGGERPADLLRQLNCWSTDDVAQYLSAVRARERQRSASGPWRLDLSWLQGWGVEVPPELQALSVA